MRTENKDIIDSPSIGRRIRNLRENKGLSIKELADRANLSATSLSDIENGRKRAGLTTLVLVNKELEASLDYLVYGPGTLPKSYEEMLEEKIRRADTVDSILDDQEIGIIAEMIKQFKISKR